MSDHAKFRWFLLAPIVLALLVVVSPALSFLCLLVTFCVYYDDIFSIVLRRKCGFKGRGKIENCRLGECSLKD